MSYSFTFTGLDTPFQIGVQSAPYTVDYVQAGESAGQRRFKFTVSGEGLAAADFTLEGENSPVGSEDWIGLPLTLVGGKLVGYWGPVGGFPVTADYSGSSRFRSTVNLPASNAGFYTLTAELVDGADASLSPAIVGTKSITVAQKLAAAGNYEVDPISRIEGHLGVKLTVGADGLVDDAEAHGNLWRGFENFLVGREPNDAITFTQRICGVCPVPHGLAATYAADAVFGYNDNFQTWVTADEDGKWGGDTGMDAAPADTPADKGIPEKAVLIRNVVLSSEFLMSSITHSYHLAAPSYVQGPAIPPWTPYFDDSYYHPLLLSNGRALPTDSQGFSENLWSAVIKQYVKALRIRRLVFEAGALFAGRMPMTSCFVAGGVTNDNTANLAEKCGKYRDMMVEIGTFIVKEYVPLFLALGALYPGFDNSANGGSGYGAGVGNFLSWGAFPQKDGTLGVARGYRLADGTSGTIGVDDVRANLREHITHSRYAGSVTALNADGTPVVTVADVTDPSTEYRTVPKRDDADKYSWLKAPRWTVDGVNYPMEVGPLARLVVGGLYPVDGSDLKVNAKLGPVYMTYTKSDAVTGELGLDPAMIGSDLAVALVREGLATLKTSLNNGATLVTVDKNSIVGLTKAQLLAGYTYKNAAGVAIKGAYIMGTVRNWVVDLSGGLSIMDRLRARAIESLVLILKMVGSFSKNSTDITWPAVTDAVNGGWIQQLLAAGAGATYRPKGAPTAETFGFGATEAPRGALMHMSTIKNGKIIKYQCIVPTTWNASPKDVAGVHGPLEKAMIDVPYSAAGASFTPVGGGTQTTGGGVEALRVAQSFDPCIACAVH